MSLHGSSKSAWSFEQFKECVMDVSAQISLNLVRSAGLPPFLPVMFFSKRRPAKYSLFLSGDHYDFTSFNYMNQANLLGHFSRTQRMWWMNQPRLAWALKKQLALPISFQSCFPAKGCQQSTYSLFSLAIIVILFPLTTRIKQICLVFLAVQRGCFIGIGPD